MFETITSILTPTLGIELSPFPIVDLIMILLSKKAKLNSMMYSIGWIMGNSLSFIIGYLFFGIGTSSTSEPKVFKVILLVFLAVALIFLGVKNIREFYNHKGNDSTPKWMDKTTNIDSKGAFIFSLFLAALNPKKLMLSISTGVLTSSASLPMNEVIFVAIFLLLFQIQQLLFQL